MTIIRKLSLIVGLFLLIQAAASSQDAEVIDLAQAQRDLQRLGYDVGPADGIVGNRTIAAIEQFQARIGAPVTGQVSNELAIVLRHYYVISVEVPKGALVMGVRPGNLNVERWLNARVEFNEDIPILECEEGTTVITDVGVKCVEG